MDISDLDFSKVRKLDLTRRLSSRGEVEWHAYVGLDSYIGGSADAFTLETALRLGLQAATRKERQAQDAAAIAAAEFGPHFVGVGQ